MRVVDIPRFLASVSDRHMGITCEILRCSVFSNRHSGEDDHSHHSRHVLMRLVALGVFPRRALGESRGSDRAVLMHLIALGPF